MDADKGIRSLREKKIASRNFPLANFFPRSDLFPLSVLLITLARRRKMNADKGKRSLSRFSTSEYFRAKRPSSVVGIYFAKPW